MIQFAIVLIINRRCYNARKIIYIENKINVVEIYGLQLREKTENEGMLKTNGVVYSRTEKNRFISSFLVPGILLYF